MTKRTIFLLLAIILLTAVSCTLVYAQTNIRPTEEVFGTGAISVHNTNVGILDIKVSRSGDIISGGFTYREMGPDSRTPVTVISSARITGLRTLENHASIIAVGYWNNMEAYITIEVADNANPTTSLADRINTGDWFKIEARPRGPLTIIYQAGGALKWGDLVVRGLPKPDIYARGEGSIAIGYDKGVFAFKAERVKGVIQGSIHFEAYDSRAASIIPIPKVKIDVPEVRSFDLCRNAATLIGKGTLNGRPAMVTVHAMDNSVRMSPIPTPDMFYIRAVTIDDPRLDIPALQYSAGGPLVSGDIEVGLIPYLR